LDLKESNYANKNSRVKMKITKKKYYSNQQCIERKKKKMVIAVGERLIPF